MTAFPSCGTTPGLVRGLTAVIACILLMLVSLTSVAGELRPFVSGSMQKIVATHNGRPLIVHFWSLSCPPCLEELAMWARLTKKFPDLNLVMVSTDTSSRRGAVRATLKRYGLDQRRNWIFADEFVERLRFQIDRRWYGELPRTYFFAVDGQSESISGRLKAQQVEVWWRQQHRGKAVTRKAGGLIGQAKGNAR